MSTQTLNCPVSRTPGEVITLAHGEGGQASRRLIEELIIPRLNSTLANTLDDAVALPKLKSRPVMTTDSFVVSPLFFPGGDIGKLAIFGTVNDLAVSGAKPLWISLSMIIEEGFALSLLEQVLDSIAFAANVTGVQVVTGDTKIVPKGVADGLFLTTTGLGELLSSAPLGPESLAEGDRIIATGPIGKHGIAILAAREDLGFKPMPESDCASLWPAAQSLRGAGCPVRAMRDATRGGVAAVLQEWAAASGTTMAIDEDVIPVSGEVRGACELLGLDPLFLPNEGTMLIAVPEGSEEIALKALWKTENHQDAAVIGTIMERRPVTVYVRRGHGVEIPLDEPHGAPLPRIC